MTRIGKIGIRVHTRQGLAEKEGVVITKHDRPADPAIEFAHVFSGHGFTLISESSLRVTAYRLPDGAEFG